MHLLPPRHNTNIWHEGRFQLARLQPAPVDAFEQRMSLYVTYALPTAAQAHSGIFVQQLYNTSSTYSIDTLHSAHTKTSNLYDVIAAPPSSTCLQQDLASSVNLLEYTSSSSRTRRSTSSRLTFSLRARNGAYTQYIHP